MKIKLKDLFDSYLLEALIKEFGNIEFNSDNDVQLWFNQLVQVVDSVDQKGFENSDYKEIKKYGSAHGAILSFPEAILQNMNVANDVLMLILKTSEDISKFHLSKAILTEVKCVVPKDIEKMGFQVLKAYAGKEKSNNQQISLRIVDEYEGVYKSVEIKTKQSIRFFGYYMFNGTIDLKVLGDQQEVFYLDYIQSNPKVFAEACCVYINNFNSKNNSHQRCAQWIRKSMDADYEVTFEEWELNFETIGLSFESSFKKMVFEISKSQFCVSLLPDLNFHEFVECSSDFLEMVFAIWTNVIKLDEKGEVLNLVEVEYRVAQYIKSWLNDDYEITPEFMEWEMILY